MKSEHYDVESLDLKSTASKKDAEHSVIAKLYYELGLHNCLTMSILYLFVGVMFFRIFLCTAWDIYQIDHYFKTGKMI